jgi:hypothetical protein
MLVVRPKQQRRKGRAEDEMLVRLAGLLRAAWAEGVAGAGLR